ncbi:MAG TPA: CPBP family intramembrane glutamic endopeptidase [Candidatus Deferrimicrobium sp.]|nr:CPBP family intramembrane glutamic endopeptidase [Candidatus Deferrimicrobium sp.]
MSESPQKVKKTTSLLIVIALYLAITITNEFLLLKGLALPLFSKGYILEHFWIRNYIHHFGQMILSLLVIALLLKGHLKDYGLNVMNWSISRKYILWFFLIYGAITLLNFLPNFLQRRPESVGFSLTSSNILGWLSFQGLMSGTSEEIFFRGLLQTLLSKAWTGSVKIWKSLVPSAGLIAAVIFTFAHMEFAFDPFAVNYSVSQLVVAFILGILYSVAYDRTKSLIAPILMHNYANLIMYCLGGLTVLLFA